MAFSVTAVERNYEISNANSATTGTRTPSANKLQVIAVVSNCNNDFSWPSFSGQGIDWQLGARVALEPGDGVLAVYWGIDEAPTNGGILIDYGVGAYDQYSIAWHILEIDGIDLTTPVVQANGNVSTVAGSSLSVGLNAFAKATNGTLNFSAVHDSAAANWAPGTGSVVSDYITQDGGTMTLGTAWLASEDTTVTASISPSSFQWGMVALEINLANDGSVSIGVLA